MKQRIRIGSRASRLAVAQSMLAMAQIQQILPDTALDLVTMKTTGDKILHKTLDKVGGKGLFLKELETALLSDTVDLCVHSLKDVPIQENPALPIGAYLTRKTAADVLVLPVGETQWDKTKPVGCAGARRAMQLRRLFPEITVQPIRGNVLTRLEKLDCGDYGALVLAEAGLKRLGLENRIFQCFSPDELVPAAGQGILAIQSRVGEYSELLSALNDTDTAFCARLERHIIRQLGGDCSAPVGCYAELHGTDLTIYGFSGIDGISKTTCLHGSRADCNELAKSVILKLQ